MPGESGRMGEETHGKMSLNRGGGGGGIKVTVGRSLSGLGRQSPEVLSQGHQDLHKNIRGWIGLQPNVELE